MTGGPDWTGPFRIAGTPELTVEEEQAEITRAWASLRARIYAFARRTGSPSSVDQRPRPCCMCGAVVHIATSTTKHPEAPEMLQPPLGAWIGFVSGDHAPEMIVVCSEQCRLNLLSA